LLLEAVWDKEFELIGKPSDISFPEHYPTQEIYEPPVTQQEVKSKSHTPQDGDNLAHTAGLLIESVRDTQNPKFHNSKFMGLMRQLRDREVVVEGDKMVESGSGTSDARWTDEVQVDVKGKGRAVDLSVPSVVSAEQLDARRAFRSVTRSFSPAHRVLSPAIEHPVEDTAARQEEDPNDAYFRQENADYIDYWAMHHTEPAGQTSAAGAAMSQDAADWDRMQQEWDTFEAHAAGISAVDNYQFQENNPYLLGDRSRNHQHMAQLDGPQSLYEVC
jgi:peroxin-5